MASHAQKSQNIFYHIKFWLEGELEKEATNAKYRNQSSDTSRDWITHYKKLYSIIAYIDAVLARSYK